MKCDITGRLLANVERVGALFGVPIADGYALVLAQMLGPGLDDDEQTRAKCAVSQTLLPYRLHGIGKFMRVIGVNAVFDSNQHRALLRVRLHDHGRLRPMRRRSQV